MPDQAKTKLATQTPEQRHMQLFGKPVDAIDKTRLEKFRGDWTDALEVMANVPCETADQDRWWTEKLAYLQGGLADLEAERQTLVRPLIDDKTRIDKMFKEACAPAEKVKALIKGKRGAFAEACLKLQQEAQQAARLAAEAGDAEGCALALETAEAAQVGKSTSFVWTVEVVDPTALPREYWVIDYAKLEAIATEARSSEKAPVVPGVTFKRTARVSARRGKAK